MKISIVIAVYNEEDYIESCLHSIYHQDFSEFEIIVIDDGSSDNTYQKISNLESQISNFRVFRQKHQGPALARNRGAKKAKGKVLVFVDGDMYFEKSFLKKLVSPILKGKAKGTYSTEEYIANWDNIWARCWNYNWNLPDEKRIDEKRGDQQKDFRAILKKEFLKVGGFSSTGYTDTWTLSKKLGYRPQPTKAVYYHYNPSSLEKVFNQAKWVGKREYKLGLAGKIITLMRKSLPFSLFFGLKKACQKKEPAFLEKQFSKKQ